MADTPFRSRVLSDGANLAVIVGTALGAFVTFVGFVVWLSVLHSDVQELKSDVSAIRLYLMPQEPRRPMLAPEEPPTHRLSERTP